MDAAGQKLSAAEKKTIEFGLAVVILSACPSAGPSAAVEGCGKQRASKQLRLWQGSCLGGLAEAGSRARPDLAETSHRQQQREAGPVGGRTDSLRAAGAAELHVQGNQPGRCGVVPAGSFVSPAAEPMRRLLASDGGSDLRALGAVALSGCQSESARAVQKEALEGLWHGDCSPEMVSLFAKQMLEQVVIRGQGGGGQVYRHVLDLMVSITADVAAAASSLASGDNNGGAVAGAPAAAAAVAVSMLARRLDVGLAVSQALDAVLVQLARELRRGFGSGGAGRVVVTGTRSSRQHHSPSAATAAATATARAAGAGLYLDAYEAATACLLRAFNCLAQGDPERERRAPLPPPSPSPSSRNRGDSLRPNQPPGTESRGGNKRSSDESFGVRNRGQGQGASIRQFGPTASERVAERGVLPRGWRDASARRNAWTQRKLEVLAEATTTMSSFRMGQLRLQRIVARVYEWARSA